MDIHAFVKHWSRENVGRFLFILATVIFGLLLATVLITALIFVVGLSVGAYIFPLALLLAGGLAYAAAKKYFPYKTMPVFLAVVGILVILIIVSLIISTFFIDMSWDGLEYHQAAVIKMVEGWNPVYQRQDQAISSDATVHIWVNHYPKASWYFQAAVGKLTGNIEQGKIINLLSLIASLCMALACLLRIPKIKTGHGILISLLAAFNPVSVFQAFSFYTDGLVSSLIVSLFALGILLYFVDEDRLHLFVLASIIIILINLKYSGLFYAFMFSLPLVFKYIIGERKLRFPIKIIGTGLAAVIIAIFLVGASSYVKNTVTNGHPLYPLRGDNKIDVMLQQYPVNFIKMNRMQRLYHTLFSTVNNDWANGTFASSSLKNPFVYSKPEIRAFGDNDTRVAGYGPLTGAFTIVSLGVFMLLILYLVITGRWKNLLFYGLIFGFISATVLLFPESWWARLAPHLWLVPVVVLGLVAYTVTAFEHEHEVLIFRIKHYVVKGAAYLLTLVLIANMGMILGSYVYHRHVQNVNERLFFSQMAKADENYHVYLGRFETAFEYRFKKYNIDYTLTDDYSFRGYRNIIMFEAGYGLVGAGIPREVK